MAISVEIRLMPGETSQSTGQRIWNAIMVFGQEDRDFTLADLRNAAQIYGSYVPVRFLKELLREGVITNTNGRPLRYRLVDAATPNRPRPNELTSVDRAHQQMWNLLRGPQARGGIKPRDLAVLASTEPVAISSKAAMAFCTMLTGHGYLSRTGNLFRLLPRMNTGPIVPRLMRADFVLDPNRQQIARTRVPAKEVAS
jgi:hypothetical protein